MNKAIRPTLMAYFAKNAGVHIFLNDLVAATKLDKDQVQGNVNNIIRDYNNGTLDFHLECVTRGQVWIHRPGQQKAAAAATKAERPKRVFEELATTKSGKLLIQDDGGIVYEAIEL